MLLVALGLIGALVQAQPATGGAVISGRVLEQGTLAPIAGAQVVLVRQFQGPPPDPLAFRPTSATTDESGRFQFSGVEPGRYRVSAQKTGFAMPVAASGSVPVELKSGAAAAVDVFLQRGGVIAGRVVDPLGEPVVDARVMALRKPPTPPRALSPAAAAAVARFANRLMPAGPGAQTNDLGEFRLHSLPPGEYYVAASRADFRGAMPASGTRPPATAMVPTFFLDTADPQAAQSIQVGAGQTTGDVVIRMVIAPVFQITGVVSDEAGQPVANAMVRLTPQDPAAPLPMMGPPSQARTDANGAFLLPGVTNGTYTLIAVPPNVIAGAPGTTSGAGVSAVWSGSTSSGGRGGMVSTESRNGTTVQYRDDAGTQMPVVVNEASVTGLQVVVRRVVAR